MFFKFGTLKKNGIKAGIAFSDEGLYLAIVSQKRKGDFSLLALEKVATSDPLEQVETLRTWASKHKLENCTCNAVLNHHDYAIYQIDAPPVPEEELNTSAKWSIKEFIDYPVEKAVVDTFELPHSNRVGTQKTIQVVAANSDSIRRISDTFKKAKIALECIDICELALHNISNLISAKEERALTYIYEIEKQAFIEISQSTLLYLTRNFPIYSGVSDRLGGDWINENDNTATVELCLEIQRSLDYFESHYSRGAASQITAVRFSDQIDSMIDSTAPYLSTPVQSINLSEHIQCPEGISLPNDNGSLLAVGAALREAA